MVTVIGGMPLLSAGERMVGHIQASVALDNLNNEREDHLSGYHRKSGV